MFPPNGVISYTSGTLLGSMATYTCDPGYDLIGGDALRTCSSDGDWNGMEPTGCQRKCALTLSRRTLCKLELSFETGTIKYRVGINYGEVLRTMH